jgi:hypothetical protein
MEAFQALEMGLVALCDASSYTITAMRLQLGCVSINGHGHLIILLQYISFFFLLASVPAGTEHLNKLWFP